MALAPTHTCTHTHTHTHTNTHTGYAHPREHTLGLALESWHWECFSPGTDPLTTCPVSSLSDTSSLRTCCHLARFLASISSSLSHAHTCTHTHTHTQCCIVAKGWRIKNTDRSRPCFSLISHGHLSWQLVAVFQNVFTLSKLRLIINYVSNRLTNQSVFQFNISWEIL